MEIEVNQYYDIPEIKLEAVREATQSEEANSKITSVAARSIYNGSIVEVAVEDGRAPKEGHAHVKYPDGSWYEGNWDNY
jgi:ribosomal protein S4E